MAWGVPSYPGLALTLLGLPTHHVRGAERDAQLRICALPPQPEAEAHRAHVQALELTYSPVHGMAYGLDAYAVPIKQFSASSL